jgi:ABC-type branched-subunit amino acid transport system ATPase component
MTDALVLDHIRVQFGGLLAVDDVSLTAPAGQITGLIGPNGAGKSTTFDASCGAVAVQGSVRLGDRTLDGRSPSRRAQLGLGRTFQRIQLFETMTARDNVAMGPEMHDAGSRAWRHLAGRSRRHTLDLADEALERCGISDLAERLTADLSTGERRLVELARAMACPFRFLLLDEPSSGLDPSETERFGDLLLEIAGQDGTGILLVEHDMALVRRVCSHVYVLDFGKLVFDGPTDEVLRSDLVKAAYLGSEAVEEGVG